MLTQALLLLKLKIEHKSYTGIVEIIQRNCVSQSIRCSPSLVRDQVRVSQHIMLVTIINLKSFKSIIIP